MSGRLSADESEMAARIELAAAHRVAAVLGWTSIIFNHIAIRLPNRPDCFLVKADHLLYEEVTASNLVELRVSDGEPVRESALVNAAAATIHSALLAARPELNSSIHVHTDGGVALSCMPKGLRPHSQPAMMFYNRIGYHAFEGVVDAMDERARIVRDLGTHNALVLRNHGLLTCGKTMGDTMIRMTQLIEAARIQMMLYASQEPYAEPPPEVCERAAQQFDRHIEGGGLASPWQALLRVVDRQGDISYRM